MQEPWRANDSELDFTEHGINGIRIWKGLANHWSELAHRSKPLAESGYISGPAMPCLAHGKLHSRLGYPNRALQSHIPELGNPEIEHFPDDVIVGIWPLCLGKKKKNCCPPALVMHFASFSIALVMHTLNKGTKMCTSLHLQEARSATKVHSSDHYRGVWEEGVLLPNTISVITLPQKFLRVPEGAVC